MNLNEAGNMGAVQRYDSPKEIRSGNVPLSVTLKEKLMYHEQQIMKIQATLKLLETNQDIEKLLFLIGEIH